MDTLVWTAITRFGTILFIVYTISILLNLYRYTMRMSAYYESRAESLSLMTEFGDAEAKRFQMFVDALAAERVDFGKQPTTPIEQVMEAARSLRNRASVRGSIE